MEQENEQQKVYEVLIRKVREDNQKFQQESEMKLLALQEALEAATQKNTKQSTNEATVV